MTSMDRSCAFYIVRPCLKLGGDGRKACGVCVAFGTMYLIFLH